MNNLLLPKFKHSPILALLTFMIMLQPLSTDIYLASIPSLVEIFNVPFSKVQLTLSFFVISFGLTQLIIGPLSDKFGRLPLLYIGLSIYILSSFLCAIVISIDQLIIARFLQAAGCCVAAVIGRSLVRDAFSSENSAKVMARASSWISLAPLFGPILGSYLEVNFGWQSTFIFLATISIIFFYLCL